jgi:hypothetical protein
MASVHSGFSLSIISGSGFFFIAFYLPFVGAAQADNPHRRTGFGEDQSMKAVPDITECEKAGFAVAAGRYGSWLWSNRIQRATERPPTIFSTPNRAPSPWSPSL